MSTTPSTKRVVMRSSKTSQIEENSHGVNISNGVELHGGAERRLQKSKVVQYHIMGIKST